MSIVHYLRSPIKSLYDRIIQAIAKVTDDIFVCGGGFIKILWKLGHHPLLILPLHHNPRESFGLRLGVSVSGG
ncbi:MAG: hypothetical protein ACKO4S_17070 [Snowella sp.]